MVEQVYIYGLHEEGNEEIRYVGKTVNPGIRLAQHLSIDSSAKSNLKRQWVEECLQRSVGVKMKILEQCGALQGDDREQHWIDHHAAMGCRLTNNSVQPHSPSTQKNRNLTFYTDDAKATAEALKMVAASLYIGGSRGPTPSELVQWILLNKDAVLEALRPVRKAELEQKIGNVSAARTGERAEKE
jgi:hypothetical protein